MIQTQKEQIRQAAETDLKIFIRLIHPGRMLGSVHEELISWWNREDAKTHQLVLLPRDHMKSALIAYRCAQTIAKNPAVRILYISSTTTLAMKQLKFIKDILESKIFQMYWPDMINPVETSREKWTEREISVDHPKRKEENLRDSTVFTAGLDTGIAGLHCDIAVLDDVVVRDNAYTSEGRDKVATQYSLLSSIEGSDSQEWVVGTRYFMQDLYQTMQEFSVEDYDDEGNVVGADPIYEVFERKVEDKGDGSGEFLWPRQQRSDGKWFGFDQRILAEKRAKYIDKLQFRAQYYNDPTDPDDQPITRDMFQYYDKGHLKKFNDRWFYRTNRLNVFAAIDFAFSLKKKADFTSVVIVGVDYQNNYYILDIERFKTDRIHDYYQAIFKMYNKWGFRKIRAEVSVAQQVIINDIKDNYIRPNGLVLSVEEFRPSRFDGNKEERVSSVLQPRYDNRQIWHYKGGNCSILEEELMLRYPPHDDVKDCLASCIEACITPSKTFLDNIPDRSNPLEGLYNPRFGGMGAH